MSRKGNCYDNATAEAFFSSFKAECLPVDCVFASKQEARREIFEYLEVYYNKKRLHSSLGYQTPVEYESSFTAALAPALNPASGNSAPREDKALRGRNLSAHGASKTAGRAASRPPAGPSRRIEPHAINPRGFGGQRPPSSTHQN